VYAEMVCKCDAYLNIDSEDDASVWTLVHRFVNAHVECGFVTGGESPERVVAKHKLIMPRRPEESGES